MRRFTLITSFPLSANKVAVGISAKAGWLKLLRRSNRRRASVVVIEDGKILGFNGEDPKSGVMYFFLPGGMIDPGETASEAGVRETLEETGYEIELIPGIEVRERYDFAWNGSVVDCTTQFFLGKLVSKKARPVSDVDYHRGVDWISVTDAEKVFSYSAAISSSVQKLILLASRR